MLLYHFNAITPENLMKPDAMQPSEGNYEFSAADDMVQFADENNLAAVGHTFAWYQQTPEWMAENCTREEAIAIANQSCYGLMGAVFSKDLGTALKMAEQMQCGGVVINGASDFRSSEMPFGGYKKSGLGREGVSRTLYEMMQEKSYVLKQVL